MSLRYAITNRCLLPIVFICTGLLAQTPAAAAGKSPKDLVVAVPSAQAIAGQPAHIYKPGYEAAVVKAACKMLSGVRCIVKEANTYPTEASWGVPGAHAALFGPDIAEGPAAQEIGLGEAVQQLAEDETLWQLKKQFMATDKPWPTPLAVGVDMSSEAMARNLCSQMKAKCSYVRGKDFADLSAQYDAKKLQLVVHSQSWMFATKALEDRVNFAREKIERASTGKS